MKEPLIIWACSPPDDEAIILAKKWIIEQGYTKDDVDLKKSDLSVYVQFKKESTYE